MMRLELDEAAFRRLVAGQIVGMRSLGHDGVEITLSPDIGWVRLMRAILDAADQPPPGAGNLMNDPPVG